MRLDISFDSPRIFYSHYAQLFYLSSPWFRHYIWYLSRSRRCFSLYGRYYRQCAPDVTKPARTAYDAYAHGKYHWAGRFHISIPEWRWYIRFLEISAIFHMMLFSNFFAWLQQNGPAMPCPHRQADVSRNLLFAYHYHYASRCRHAWAAFYSLVTAEW